MTDEEREMMKLLVDDAEAMRRFIWTEMSWEDFRDEMLGDTTSGKNFKKLQAFLERDDCGLSRRLQRVREMIDYPLPKQDPPRVRMVRP